MTLDFVYLPAGSTYSSFEKASLGHVDVPPSISTCNENVHNNVELPNHSNQGNGLVLSQDMDDFCIGSSLGRSG